jgi:hypothetical protein
MDSFVGHAISEIKSNVGRYIGAIDEINVGEVGRMRDIIKGNL